MGLNECLVAGSGSSWLLLVPPGPGSSGPKKAQGDQGTPRDVTQHCSDALLTGSCLKHANLWPAQVSLPVFVEACRSSN